MMNPKCYTRIILNTSNDLVAKHLLNMTLKYSKLQLQIRDFDFKFKLRLIGCLQQQQLPPPIAAILPI